MRKVKSCTYTAVFRPESLWLFFPHPLNVISIQSSCSTVMLTCTPWAPRVLLFLIPTGRNQRKSLHWRQLECSVSVLSVIRTWALGRKVKCNQPSITAAALRELQSAPARHYLGQPCCCPSLSSAWVTTEEGRKAAPTKLCSPGFRFMAAAEACGQKGDG